MDPLDGIVKRGGRTNAANPDGGSSNPYKSAEALKRIDLHVLLLTPSTVIAVGGG